MASIRKLPSGKYQLSFINSAGVRTRRNYKLWKEADAARKEVEAKIARGVDRPHGDEMKLGDLLDAYAAHLKDREVRREIARKHYAVVAGHIENHLKNPEWGISGVRLRHLTSGVISQFRDDMRKNSGASVVTVRKVISTLHSALAFGQERDLIAHNPAAGIKVDAKRSEGARKITPPSKEAFMALLAACEGPPLQKENKRERARKRGEALLHAAILFAGFSGLRASEQWALRWSDVDFKVGEVEVSKRVDGYRIEDDPKSKAGFRRIPLSDHLLSELRAWRLRSGFAKDEDLVFTNHRGSFINHDNLTKRHFLPAVEIAAKKAGVEPFGWHALRHFAVSCWIESGQPLKVVSTWAGHSSVSITADRYGHLFKDESRRDSMNEIAKGLFA